MIAALPKNQVPVLCSATRACRDSVDSVEEVADQAQHFRMGAKLTTFDE